MRQRSEALCHLKPIPNFSHRYLQIESSRTSLSDSVYNDARTLPAEPRDVKIQLGTIKSHVVVVEASPSPAKHLQWVDDPRNPLRWSVARRWAMIWLLAIAADIASTFSTAFEPALPVIMVDLGSNSPSVASLLISIYMLGYIVGPIIIAPISELYGRLPVIYAAYVVFLGSTALCAISRNVGMFAVFRIVMGFGGVAFLLMGPAVASDIIPREKRGLAMAILSIGPLVGPTLGPVIGGYTSQALGWKWIFWITLISMSLCGILTAIVLRESYAPVLLKVSSNNNPLAGCRTQQDAQKKTRLAWIRPLSILFKQPIVLALALHSSMANSYAMVLAATTGTVFQSNYNMSAGASGLTYLGTTVGFLIGQMVMADLSDRYMLRKESLKGEKKPEYRLPPLLMGSVLIPLGIVWRGWALQLQVHWIVPIVASAIIATGIVAVSLAVQTYLLDAFTIYSTSALGANIIVRSVFGAVVPLAANPLYDRLGYGWSGTVFACIATLFIPSAILLLRFGERIRTNPRFRAVL